jgi:hypothetical protein
VIIRKVFKLAKWKKSHVLYRGTNDDYLLFFRNNTWKNILERAKGKENQ